MADKLEKSAQATKKPLPEHQRKKMLQGHGYICSEVPLAGPELRTTRSPQPRDEACGLQAPAQVSAQRCITQRGTSPACSLLRTALGACASTGTSLEKEHLPSYKEVHSLCVVTRLRSPNQLVGTGSQPPREQAQKSPAEVSIPFLFYNPATERTTVARDWSHGIQLLTLH